MLTQKVVPKLTLWESLVSHSDHVALADNTVVEPGEAVEQTRKQIRVPEKKTVVEGSFTEQEYFSHHFLSHPKCLHSSSRPFFIVFRAITIFKLGSITGPTRSTNRRGSTSLDLGSPPRPSPVLEPISTLFEGFHSEGQRFADQLCRPRIGAGGHCILTTRTSAFPAATPRPPSSALLFDAQS